MCINRNKRQHDNPQHTVCLSRGLVIILSLRQRSLNSLNRYLAYVIIVLCKHHLEDVILLIRCSAMRLSTRSAVIYLISVSLPKFFRPIGWAGAGIVLLLFHFCINHSESSGTQNRSSMKTCAFDRLIDLPPALQLSSLHLIFAHATDAAFLARPLTYSFIGF